MNMGIGIPDIKSLIPHMETGTRAIQSLAVAMTRMAKAIEDYNEAQRQNQETTKVISLKTNQPRRVR